MVVGQRVVLRKNTNIIISVIIHWQLACERNSARSFFFLFFCFFFSHHDLLGVFIFSLIIFFSRLAFYSSPPVDSDHHHLCTAHVPFFFFCMNKEGTALQSLVSYQFALLFQHAAQVAVHRGELGHESNSCHVAVDGFLN